MEVPTHTVNMTTLRSTHDIWQSYSMSPYEVSAMYSYCTTCFTWVSLGSFFLYLGRISPGKRRKEMCSCVGRKSCSVHPNSHLHFFPGNREDRRAEGTVVFADALGTRSVLFAGCLICDSDQMLRTMYSGSGETPC